MRYFYIGILIIITFQVSYSQENRENDDFLTDKMPRVLKDWNKLIEQYNVQSPFLKGNPVHINKGRLTGGGKLVQKNLVDDPVTIRRFTKSVAHEYWGNDKNIFAQVYGIMIMPTPVGRLLFACDPIWSRIMWTVQGSIDIPGFGSYGTGPGQFKDPRDIAGKYPNLFIADPWNHRVPHYKVVIDSLQTPFGTWIKYVKEIQFIQNIGEGFLYLPFGLDYSDNGTPENIEDDLIYVADAGSSFIAKFSIDGDLISTYGKWGSGYGEFWHPGDVAVGKDMGVNTEDIFVLDYANARVVKYPHIDPNAPNFYFLTYQWPNTSTFHIRSIAVDYFGFPYVSDSEDRIVKYQIDLSDTLWSYGTHGFGDGHFNEIHDIYILQDELIATERWANNSGISSYWIVMVPFPMSFFITQNYPNPFSSFTKISYAVPGANPSGTSQVHSFNASGFSGLASVERKVSLRIYNVNGQLVRVLVDKSQKSGYYTVGWDGRNLNKKQVTSGIYFYRLKIDNFVATGKMVIFR